METPSVFVVHKLEGNLVQDAKRNSINAYEKLRHKLDTRLSYDLSVDYVENINHPIQRRDTHLDYKNFAKGVVSLTQSNYVLFCNGWEDDTLCKMYYEAAVASYKTIFYEKDLDNEIRALPILSTIRAYLHQNPEIEYDKIDEIVIRFKKTDSKTEEFQLKFDTESDI